NEYGSGRAFLHGLASGTGSGVGTGTVWGSAGRLALGAIPLALPGQRPAGADPTGDQCLLDGIGSGGPRWAGRPATAAITSQLIQYHFDPHDRPPGGVRCFLLPSGEVAL